MQQTIGRHMVKSPYVGDTDFGLKKALEMMVECNIRHLPVVDLGKLVGLVSERDVREALALPQAEKIVLGDIMKTDLFVAVRTSPLQDVVRSMQEQKLGSALIVNDKMECVGIFTTIDALGILADMLDEDGEATSVLHLDDYIDYWKVPDSMVI